MTHPNPAPDQDAKPFDEFFKAVEPLKALECHGVPVPTQLQQAKVGVTSPVHWKYALCDLCKRYCETVFNNITQRSRFNGFREFLVTMESRCRGEECFGPLHHALDHLGFEFENKNPSQFTAYRNGESRSGYFDRNYFDIEVDAFEGISAMQMMHAKASIEYIGDGFVRLRTFGFREWT